MKSWDDAYGEISAVLQEWRDHRGKHFCYYESEQNDGMGICPSEYTASDWLDEHMFDTNSQEVKNMLSIVESDDLWKARRTAVYPGRVGDLQFDDGRKAVECDHGVFRSCQKCVPISGRPVEKDQFPVKEPEALNSGLTAPELSPVVFPTETLVEALEAILASLHRIEKRLSERPQDSDW